MALVSFIDDMHPLSAKVRLLIQTFFFIIAAVTARSPRGLVGIRGCGFCLSGWPYSIYIISWMV